MRVICINDNWECKSQMEDAPLPVFNNEYVVANTVPVCGFKFHRFENFGEGFAYMASHFAILPDQPEEVIEEEELATA